MYSVKFIADYNGITDKLITEFQREIEYLIIDLDYNFISNKADYGNYTAIYKQIKTDFRLLGLRTSAFPKNELTLKQVKILQENFHPFEEIHKEELDDMILIEEPRKDFTLSFIKILKLELAKKRGE